MQSVNHEKWVELYQRAVLKEDERKMSERIFAARQVLGELLRGLANDKEEKEQIEETLRGLTLLEGEMGVVS